MCKITSERNNNYKFYGYMMNLDSLHLNISINSNSICFPFKVHKVISCKHSCMIFTGYMNIVCTR